MIGLSGLGVVGLFLFIILVLLIPFVATIIVGIGLANLLGFTGIFWWAFVILFYIIITAMLAMVGV